MHQSLPGCKTVARNIADDADAESIHRRGAGRAGLDGAGRRAAGRPGQQPLKLGSDRDGLLYVPRGYKAGVPAPLLLMFHGAGNTSQSVQYAFPIADDLGIVLLAPDSRDEATWDGVLRNWGPDV